jgi:NAD(P)H dehydrogenase (quinone)
MIMIPITIFYLGGGIIVQILVLYYSKGGNTRKLAEVIKEGVEQVEAATAILKNTREVRKEDFLAAELKKIFEDFISLRRQTEGKVGAAFATSGDPSGGKETTMMTIIQAMLIYGMVIVGDPMAATGHYGTACTGAPNAAIEENGRKLGQRVAQIAQKLKS